MDAKKRDAPEQKSMKNRVAVVGSGVAGLSAAYLMHRNGKKVTLYESAPRCGGHALTVDSTAGPVDLGFQVRETKRKRDRAPHDNFCARHRHFIIARTPPNEPLLPFALLYIHFFFP